MFLLGKRSHVLFETSERKMDTNGYHLSSLWRQIEYTRTHGTIEHHDTAHRNEGQLLRSDITVPEIIPNASMLHTYSYNPSASEHTFSDTALYLYRIHYCVPKGHSVGISDCTLKDIQVLSVEAYLTMLAHYTKITRQCCILPRKYRMKKVPR